MNSNSNSNSNSNISDHSNLMLVEIIYGSSKKYTQDDVLSAELELSSRNVSESEMEALKNKVAYIAGINMGGVPRTSTSSASDIPANDDEDVDDSNSGELEGSDPLLVNFLIGYIAISSLGSLGSAFSGSIKYSLVALVTLGIYGYGIYGLLNRERLPVLGLIGIFSFSLTRTVTSAFSLMFSDNMAYSLIPMVFIALGGAILYFLTKPSLRLAYHLDGESITRSVGIGIAMSFVLQFL